VSTPPDLDHERQPSPSFDAKSIVLTAAVALWLASAGLFVAGISGDWSTPTRGPLLVGCFAAAIAAATATILTGQLRGSSRRAIEATTLLEEVREVGGRLDRLEKLGGDTLTNVGDVMREVREILTVQKQMVGQMRSVADDAITQAREATSEIDDARWKLIAEQFREELGPPPVNGHRAVVPLRRPSDPSIG
jgi:hypothetical protein